MSQSARMGYPPVLLSLGLEPDPRSKVTYTPPRVRLTPAEIEDRRDLDKHLTRSLDNTLSWPPVPVVAKATAYRNWNDLVYREHPEGGDRAQFWQTGPNSDCGWTNSVNRWSRITACGTACFVLSED